MEVCPICQTPYGKRRRCYKCHGKPRTGVEKACEVCGKLMYVQPNQIEHGEGHYCSRACKGRRMSETPRPWARPKEKTMHSAGYVLVWAPDHPRASPTHKRVFEHVLVAERTLGRYLTHGEEVHHIDGEKLNNDPSNLLVVTAREHQKYHPQEPAKWVTMACQECGKMFDAEPSRAHASNPANQRKYCSNACRHKGHSRVTTGMKYKTNKE